MRSSTDIFESEFTKEEWTLIKDYFKYVKEEMNIPSKPEIVIGTARYPLGRFTIRKGLLQPFKEKLSRHADKLQDPEKKQQVLNSVNALNKVQTIIDEIRQTGKTVKAFRRKKLK